MTEFFVDLHPRYQVDFDFKAAAEQGIHGVVIKAAEGEGVRYGYFPQMVKAAQAAGLGVLPYFWIHAGDAAYMRRQADNLRAALEGTGLTKYVIDCERGSTRPTIGHVRQLITAAQPDLRCVALYLPRWYWAGDIGRPSLLVDELADVALWNSDYGKNPNGKPEQIYGAFDRSSAWQPMGGKSVTFLQFTDRAAIAGGKVDCSAYQGRPQALERFFGLEPARTRVLNARRRLDRAEQDLATARALLTEAAKHREDVKDGLQHVERAAHRAQRALETLPER